MRREYREPLAPPDDIEIRVDMNQEEPLLLKAFDKSLHGRGCLFEGNNPPQVGAVYFWTEDDCSYSRVQVCWVQRVDDNNHRVGLRLL